MMRTLAVGLVALLAAACASAPEPVAMAGSADLDAASNATPALDGPLMPTGDKDTCGAADYVGLLGKPVTSEGVPEPDTLIRHIAPDSVITLDFTEERLNLYVSREGIIQKLTCG
jgi:hypothetical protein